MQIIRLIMSKLIGDWLLSNRTVTHIEMHANDHQHMFALQDAQHGNQCAVLVFFSPFEE